jgi:hypothetical protein
MPKRNTKGNSGLWNLRMDHTYQNYTDEELAFILAMGKFIHSGAKSPTCRDILKIAHSLGYRKVETNGMVHEETRKV